MRGRRWEISTTGLDENLQLIGGDAYKGPYSVGLPVPVIGTSNRLLFMLASAQFGFDEKFRIIGMRQLLEIGADIANGQQDPCEYPLRLQVTSPSWGFTDGNVSWHLMRISPQDYNTDHLQNSDGVNFLWSDTPALLFQIPELVAYEPPWGGRPIGTPASTDFGNMHDIRFPWQCCQAWNGLYIEDRGPCRIALFASVKQTDPETRCGLVLPGGVSESALPPEDRFVLNFPSATYRRIAGAIVFEQDTMFERPHELREGIPAIDHCGDPDPRMERGGS